MAWRAFSSADRTQWDEEADTILNGRGVAPFCAVNMARFHAAGDRLLKILVPLLETLSGMQLDVHAESHRAAQ
jgi:hypothetical protein